VNIQDSQIKKFLEAGKSKEEIIKLLSDEDTRQERIKEIKSTIKTLSKDRIEKVNKLIEELVVLEGEEKSPARKALEGLAVLLNEKFAEYTVDWDTIEEVQDLLDKIGETVKAKKKIKATLGLKDTIDILAKVQADIENEKYSSGIAMLKELIKSLNKFGMNVPIDYDPKEGKIKADTYDDAREAYEIMTNSDNKHRAYERLKERFINTYSNEALQRLKALWQPEMEDAFIADIERRLEKGKIKASTRHEQLNKLKDALNCDLLVDSIVDAMSDEAFDSVYKFIIRMHDIEIE